MTDAERMAQEDAERIAEEQRVRQVRREREASRNAWWEKVLATVKVGDQVALYDRERVRIATVSRVTKKLLWTEKPWREQIDARDFMAGPLTAGQVAALQEANQRIKQGIEAAAAARKAIYDPAYAHWRELVQKAVGQDPALDYYERNFKGD